MAENRFAVLEDDESDPIERLRIVEERAKQRKEQKSGKAKSSQGNPQAQTQASRDTSNKGTSKAKPRTAQASTSPRSQADRQNHRAADQSSSRDYNHQYGASTGSRSGYGGSGKRSDQSTSNQAGGSHSPRHHGAQGHNKRTPRKESMESSRPWETTNTRVGHNPARNPNQGGKNTGQYQDRGQNPGRFQSGGRHQSGGRNQSRYQSHGNSSNRKQGFAWGTTEKERPKEEFNINDDKDFPSLGGRNTPIELPASSTCWNVKSNAAPQTSSDGPTTLKGRREEEQEPEPRMDGRDFVTHDSCWSVNGNRETAPHTCSNGPTTLKGRWVFVPEEQEPESRMDGRDFLTHDSCKDVKPNRELAPSAPLKDATHPATPQDRRESVLTEPQGESLMDGRDYSTNEEDQRKSRPRWADTECGDTEESFVPKPQELPMVNPIFNNPELFAWTPLPDSDEEKQQQN